MSFYSSALFVHVVFAILLVSSGIYTHLAMALISRARSGDGVRSHVMWLHAFVKAIPPLAGVVLASGVYMAIAGSWWVRAGRSYRWFFSLSAGRQRAW